jgi:hypothetical protein
MGVRKSAVPGNISAPYVLLLSLTLIAGGSLTAAWQFGIHAVHGGTFEASPFSAIRVDPVCVSPAAPYTVDSSLIKPTRAYTRLGSADGVIVLYDMEAKGVLRLPEDSVVLSTHRTVEGELICP